MKFLNWLKELVDTTVKKVVAVLITASTIIAAVATYMTVVADKIK